MGGGFAKNNHETLFFIIKRKTKTQELTCRAEGAPFVSVNLASCTCRKISSLPGRWLGVGAEREESGEGASAIASPVAAPGILK